MQSTWQRIFVVTFIVIRSLITTIAHRLEKWRLDEDSTFADGDPQNPTHHNAELTFIILARTSDGELATNEIPTLPMVGDVNIFLNGTPSDPDFEVEAEIMIAGELTFRSIFVPHLLAPTVRRTRADGDACDFFWFLFTQSQTIAEGDLPAVPYS